MLRTPVLKYRLAQMDQDPIEIWSVKRAELISKLREQYKKTSTVQATDVEKVGCLTSVIFRLEAKKGRKI